MATDAQSLLASAACYQCYTANGYSAELIKLALLRQILLASKPMADTSPQTLLDQAKCYQCYAANPYMLQLMELALLAQISSGGGGGGGSGAVLQDATVGPSPDPTKPAISFPTGGGGISEWDVASQTWI